MTQSPELLFVTRNIIPGRSGNGSSVLCAALIEMFEKAGLKTQTLVFKTNERSLLKPIELTAAESVRIVNEPGMSVFRKIWRYVSPGINNYFIDEASLDRELATYDWDKVRYVCTFSWDSLNVHSRVPGKVTSIASLVDLVEKGRELRRQHGARHEKRPLIATVLSRLRWRHLGDACLFFLRKPAMILEHAAQHAEELRAKGIKQVVYLPHPLPKQYELAFVPSETVRILIPGSFKGIASRIGFEYFFNELLPAFDSLRERIRRPYRFRVVGHGTMPEQFMQKLTQRADCEFGGYAEDIVEEYRNTDVILVNIPIPHGFRTRIAEAFSFGLCVVAHEANAVGMPELIDETNILMAADPKVLAEKLIHAINDPALRSRLAARARTDFESTISMDVAAVRVRKLLGLH